jgi:hypothetical protein
VEGITITGSSESDTGEAQVVFAVSKVLADGTESAIGPPAKVENIINYTAQEGSVSVTWAPDSDASYYNVYRSIVSIGEVLLEGTALGFVGRTHGTKFTDPNIVPDFTHVPPTHGNPFAPGAIEKITLSANGTGYANFATTITITDPTGTGFVGQCITDDSGAIVNVIVKYGGTGYTAPVIVFGGSGSGAVATATVRELTGTYPALSSVFQQRQIYAASADDPITIWGSRIKQFSNFAAADFVLDDDSFDFTLDTAAVAPIRHLLITKGGLLAMTQTDIWLLNGGGANQPITPTNPLAEPQSYTGVSSLRPITVGEDLLFAEGKGHAVKMLAYSEIYRSYTSEDRSILSSHLFGPGKDIIRWGYQESPYKIIWCVREDGVLLAFTSIKAEEVFAWTPCKTKGIFTDLAILREGTEDRVYVTVKRKIGGTWVKFLERMDLRQYVNVEDAWCVDCGLSLDATYPAGVLVIYHNQETDIWTTNQAFAPGTFIRGGDAILKVTGGAVCEMYAEPTNWMHGTDDSETLPIPAGSWTADVPVTMLSGLDHLEGEEVAILADGNVFPRQQVIGGKITLTSPVTRAIVGLPFSCRAKTLPIIVANSGIESKRKSIIGIGVRLDKSRGIKIGPTLDRMSELRERSTEAYGHPIRLINGMKYQLTYRQWDEEGQTYFVQDDPLPVNILSIVSDLEVGDEAD